MSHPFSPQHLLSQLLALPVPRRYWVAFSGGLDSTVLLHALASLRDALPAPLSVLHVDHGLSPHASAWAGQCEALCRKLGLELTTQKVTVERSAGSGLEAAARQARYQVFETVVGEGAMLLTAHHQDDQAETLLLQLFRGGGVHGLAAMPVCRPFARGWLARPLLGWSRGELQHYAEAHALQWVEDPSNLDTGLERNFLRHELLPQLAGRRQGIHQVLARSAELFAEGAGLLDERAAEDLATAQGPVPGSLSVAALRALSPARRRNLLHYAIRGAGLPLPSGQRLIRLAGEMVEAAEDAMPLVEWPGAEARRYRDALFLMSPLPPIPEVLPVVPWRGEDRLVLPQGLGQLQLTLAAGAGLDPARLQAAEVTIRWRRGGERLMPAGRKEHHELKKLFQEAGVAPWERWRRPLIFIDDQLAQVTGLWTAQRFACTKSDESLLFSWSSAIEMLSENNDN